ncbi:MAG: hypothetical protein AB8B83_05015 [Bdellovibrionales bacterium]
MNQFDAIIAFLTTEAPVILDGGTRQRIPSGAFNSVSPQNVFNAVRASIEFLEDGRPKEAEGLAVFQVMGEDGRRQEYFVGVGATQDSYQLLAKGSVEARVLENNRMSGRVVYITDEPISFDDLVGLINSEAVDISVPGLGADGLSTVSPEVLSEIDPLPQLPEVEVLPNVDAFSIVDEPSILGDESYLIRPNGDFVTTFDDRLSPSLRPIDEPAMEEPIAPFLPDEGLLSDVGEPEESEITPPEVVPYDGVQDITEWLVNTHDIVNMPAHMSVEPGTEAAEQQLGFAVSMVAVKIADGFIDPNARDAIVAEFERFDDPKFGEFQYSDYLDLVFNDVAGQGGEALSDVRIMVTNPDYDLNDRNSAEFIDVSIERISAERYNILLNEPQEPVPVKPHYDGAEDVSVWLSRELDIHLPERGDRASEQVLRLTVEALSQNIIDGNISSLAHGPILNVLREYDVADGLAENSYANYLELVMSGDPAFAEDVYPLDELEMARLDALGLEKQEALPVVPDSAPVEGLDVVPGRSP